MKFNGSGIAAVVGPNGCGKSNLSDAISWVLGEQSVKSLRGVRMEDVIFAGTRDKKALGMATVTMTLVPDEARLAASRLLPVEAVPSPSSDEQVVYNHDDTGNNGDREFVSQNPPIGFVPPKTEVARAAERRGEITITRRLYRSGESEYLINGKTARLRDIQDLFLGTGLGPESYAIIEQGRIGQILSNKPQDRRNVIEEAAGITKFKTRKRLAEAKLEGAKQNLSRVFDILEEVTRQVNSLKRQAAKTKRYGELKADATGYLRQLLAARFRTLEREMAQTAIELNLTSAELESAQTAIRERESGQEKILELSYATEQELTAARKQLADLKLDAERARGRLEYQTKQIAQIAQSLSSGEVELKGLEKLQEERTSELEQQTGELGELERGWAAAQEELAAKAAARQQAQSRLTEHERGLEGRRQAVLRLLGECSGLKNRITQLEAQAAASERDGEKSRSQEQQSESELKRIQQVKAELSERLAARQTDLVSVQDQRKQVEQELQEARAQLSANRHDLDRLASEASRIKGRKDSLEEIIQHRSYTTEAVKRLFTAVEHGKAEGFRPVGVLADFLEVDPQFEKATEEFLHDELEYVVVEDWSQGELGVQLMRGELNGRATFVVEKTGTENLTPVELPQPASEQGSLGKLSDALRWSNGLSHIPIAQLPRIANCFLVGERDLARSLATVFPHCWFLTPDGVNYHGQAVSGGNKSGAGPLALKRELRDMIQLERSKQTELKAAQDRLVALEDSIGALADEVERLRAQQNAQERDVLALDHESRKMAEEFQRIQSALSRARLELDRIVRERAQLDENLARDRQNLATREEARADEESSLEAGREQLAERQEELGLVAEEHSALRANQASLEERRRSVSNSRARLEAQLREVIHRRAQLTGEMEQFATERAHLMASNSELEGQSGELRVAMDEAEEQVGRLAGQELDLRNKLAAADEELKTRRADAQAHQELRSERQVALARADSDLKHLEESCRNELNIALAELAEAVGSEVDESKLGEIEQIHGEIRRKIEALGPVNPQALEEFEEAQQRQEFLSAQRQDLIDSIRDTERAIQEIDGESRKRFGEAFHAINANFREMFKVLFGGGTGEMRLTDEDNLADSGIDIVASPPGKRLQSVLLLSGGEKSLTAMALLMSIFQYTPSPFCILDEVDAPLDEPNIERLTRLLQELSGETQFIVITHAKRTMEAAQALYGVTMQEPGVSKLVSVKFKPANEGSRGPVQAEVAQEQEQEQELAAANV